MARKEGPIGGPVLGGDDMRSDARVSDWARQPFNREDRYIFDPQPRPNWRGAPRKPNRQYDRYFPRSAKR